MLVALLALLAVGPARARAQDTSIEATAEDPGIRAFVVEAYDGDTIYVDIPGWPELVGRRMPIRLNGIDTPELKGVAPEIRTFGRRVADYVAYRTIGRWIRLKNARRGLYFRLSADVMLPGGTNLNEHLLAVGFAKPYDFVGGADKPDWTEADTHVPPLHYGGVCPEDAVEGACW